MSQLQRRCGTMEVHNRLLSESPEYAKNRADIEKFTSDFLKNKLLATGRGIVRIPVVVHVVFNTQQQNVSDEQINSQMDVLNQDFRKMNPDMQDVPIVWQGLIADARVAFTLASVDPQGNPTNGIIRVQTNVTQFSDQVKFTATGGSDAWPTDKYLNIWVCPLGGGLLGYAQFPGGPANTDGIVVDFRAFGTTGTATAPFNLGRTATHEVGHWLNLFHIWGDDGTGCDGTDEVDDTPNQAGPNFGCPTFPHITCNNGPNGDMFVNYMDYVDDNCMHMFTNGQIVRVDACLAGPRSSFSQYELLGADLSIELLDIPAFIIVGNDFTVNQRVTNLGPDDATEVTLNFVVPENAQFVSSSTGCVAVNNVVTCNLGFLENGTTKDIAITIRPTNNQLICLEASVNSIEPDPNPANNSYNQCLMVLGSERIRAAKVIDSTTLNKELCETIKSKKAIISCEILDIKTEAEKSTLPNEMGNVKVEVATKIVVGFHLSNGNFFTRSFKSNDKINLMAPVGTTVSSDNLTYNCSLEELDKNRYRVTVTFRHSVQSTQNVLMDIPVI